VFIKSGRVWNLELDGCGFVPGELRGVVKFVGVGFLYVYLVSLSQRFFGAGSRTGGRVTFATKTIRGFRPSGQPMAVQIRSWRICASPKESHQRKGGPDAAYSLRSSLLSRVDRRGFLPLR
jgi:hypothetical protein